MREIEPNVRAAAPSMVRCYAMLTWPNVKSDDACVAAVGPYPTASFQVSGTFDGASVLIQGSNDGEEFYVLKDRWGAQIRLVNSMIATLGDIARVIRPAITGGGDETSLTITMVVP